MSDDSKPKIGRPTKLTPELTEEICGHIRDGNTDKDACTLCGITQATFIDWKHRGEAGEEPFSTFLEQLVEAQIRFKDYHIRNIKRHSKRSAQASQWLLERKFNQEFGQRQRLEVIEKLASWAESFDKV
ncbi:MAG: hypothetical protein KKB31_07890 [Nanoarchaeota archaeon]|nr:hypothetical protein [Nanoarchaeota archaeon]